MNYFDLAKAVLNFTEEINDNLDNNYEGLTEEEIKEKHHKNTKIIIGVGVIIVCIGGVKYYFFD